MTRFPDCRIVECSSKPDNFIEMQVGRKANESEQQSFQGRVLSVSYACDGKLTPQKMVKSAEGILRKQGYYIVYSGSDDNDNPLLTVRSNGQWLEVSTNQQGETVTYRVNAVTLADSGPKAAMTKSVDGCRDSRLVKAVGACAILECSSAKSDSVEMLVAHEEEEPVAKTLEGSVVTLRYACPLSMSPILIINEIQAALRKSGYQILFLTDDDENPMMTAKAGGQWLEVVASQPGESSGYTLTAAKVPETSAQRPPAKPGTP